MRSFFSFLILLFIISFNLTAQTVQQKQEIGNLQLINGDVINDCVIGFRTFGEMNAEKSNIILYPTWFGGNSESIERLIKKYKFIDTTKYFVIALDALGNGISSAPSNTSNFPDVTIHDMIISQYKLLKEKLDIKSVYAIVGGSMGSMQALEWAVTYPSFMKKIVAYVPSPRMSSYDLLWMNTQLNMIEECREDGMSDKEIWKISDMITELIARTPDYVVDSIDLDEFPEYLNSFNKDLRKTYTLDNYVCQLKALMKHDISANFNFSLEKAAEQIKADVFMIISERDMLVNPTEALLFAKLVNAKTLLLNNNCGHLAVSCEIDLCREEIDKFLME